ncbi:hypothetical protein C4K68_10915 [Pokkaliibacter plantistimulans]|uniref:Porin domain-containing protein n=1 Tax=Proteobacteria bacterium 228 TaxID=2083153 RepID=A0A2S5KS70_9PROT|nr:porin [Pokkaliibacter plantistimulans]PPC77369.1 hypothetical protein C4K68_10915 [Pokkaliibacter plantistimulans]
MKKSIIALAVAGALAAPAVSMADATLYGRLHFQMQFVKDQDMNIANAGHRLGVKGESEMDSGLTAFYQIETEYHNDRNGTSASGTTDADLTVRLANAGVKGDFGKVTVGRQSNPYSDIYVSDIFEYNSGVFENESFRMGNAVSYATPDLSGFGASLSFVADGTHNATVYDTDTKATATATSATHSDGTDNYNKDVDAYILGAHYEANGFYAAAAYKTAQYEKDHDDSASYTDDMDSYGLGLSYTVNNFLAAAYWEKTKTDNADDSVKNWDLAASYTMDKTTFGLAYGQSKTENEDAAKRTMVGVYQNLGGGADVYAEYGAYNEEAGDGDNVVVGYRVKF